jgi:pimeloyl-ACP methyl ester carboxylesterase
MFTSFTLRDGRTLEYADLGDPSGVPVFFFHGTPATGGQAAVVADAARSHGVRLLAPSRPGYGDSTLSPPGLKASVADVLELADRLALERFGVMGASGGGPFALAVAAVAPDRVSAVAVHAGPGVYSEVKPEVLGDDDRRALAQLADGDVDEAMRITTEIGDADLADLRGLSAAEFTAALQKMAPPGESWFDRHPDLRDVDLTAITTPVRLVYGESDRMTELTHAQWLQERLPDAHLVVVPGGHGDASFGAADETFATIAGI